MEETKREVGWVAVSWEKKGPGGVDYAKRGSARMSRARVITLPRWVRSRRVESRFACPLLHLALLLPLLARGKTLGECEARAKRFARSLSA